MVEGERLLLNSEPGAGVLVLLDSCGTGAFGAMQVTARPSWPVLCDSAGESLTSKAEINIKNVGDVLACWCWDWDAGTSCSVCVCASARVRVSAMCDWSTRYAYIFIYKLDQRMKRMMKMKTASEC